MTHQKASDAHRRKRLIIEPFRKRRIADAAKRAMDAHEKTFRRPALLNHLAGKTVAAGPEGTFRTDFSIRIIDALFMRAAEDLLFYDQGLNPLRVEDTEYLLADLMVCKRGDLQIGRAHV